MDTIKKLSVGLLALVAVLAFPLALSFFAAESNHMYVTLYDEAERQELRTRAATVSDFLSEAGITLGQSDRTNHRLLAETFDGMTIAIDREIVFTVQIDNGEPATRTALPGITVANVITSLQQEFITPFVFNGDVDRQIQNGEAIRLFTWRSRQQIDTTYLPYETIENHTSSVKQGFTHVRQEGAPGKHATVTEIIYIGGYEKNRELIGQNTLFYPTNAIIDVGTARLGQLTDVTSPDFHYVRQVRMEATAYTAGFGCTGKHPCDPWYRITASGREVEHGIVAVDRNLIPLGTRLYVEGYGFALAADVGGAIRGYRIDLFMEELSDALQFGRRNINVWILE
ncbi:MAG: 3D domain-containing protein [Defluviitaleaceae bacterium]|nr:3D domain-containing protein [Defluviitaleaceae bacterium]